MDYSEVLFLLPTKVSSAKTNILLFLCTSRLQTVRPSGPELFLILKKLIKICWLSAFAGANLAPISEEPFVSWFRVEIIYFYFPISCKLL